jgi:Ca2+-binding RTX toxin-like protein
MSARLRRRRLWRLAAAGPLVAVAALLGTAGQAHAASCSAWPGASAGTYDLDVYLEQGESGRIVVDPPTGKLQVVSDTRGTRTFCGFLFTDVTPYNAHIVTVHGTDPGAETFHVDESAGRWASLGVTTNIDLGGGNDSLDVIGGPGDDTILFRPGAIWDAITWNGHYESMHIRNIDSWTFRSGEGYNTIDARTYPYGVQLYGGSGNDTLNGGDGPDLIFGGAGSDTISPGGGNDRVFAGDGNDVMTDWSAAAASGADRFVGEGGVDTIDYGLRSTGVNVTLGAGAADDGEPGEGDDVDVTVENVNGGNGDDHIVGGTGANLFYGGAGNDTLDGGDDDDTLIGGYGDDTIIGGAGNDYQSGEDGNDTFVSPTADGADTIIAGAGSDTLDDSGRSAGVRVTMDGSADDGQPGEGDNVLGTETILGGAGSDTLIGSAGADVLRGGGGDDLLDGGAGADDIDGGSGVDTVDYSTRTAALQVTLDGFQNDGAAGELDNVRDTVENVRGGSGNDMITGSGVANALDGGAGKDKLNGGAGNDVLTGGAGADTLKGAGGNDVLYGRDGERDVLDGGKGTDSAQIDAGLEAATNVETLLG